MQELAHGRNRPNLAVVAFLEAAGHPNVELAVSARDEMLHHLLRAHHGSIDAGLVGYFRTGLMAARVLEDVIHWRFGDCAVRVLEFASGYGRVTRFVRELLPRAEITAAEIDEGAVAFQRSVLGVSCLGTGSDPGSISGGGFDVVFAASFFSHLPEPRFDAWLRKLYGLLAPGGVLVLSTHGADALPRGRAMPADGIYFEEVSESDRFVPAEYGSTWVSEGFVGRLIERISSDGARYRCFRRALWHSQDVYVIVPGETADLPSLSLQRQSQGYLYTCHLEDPSTLIVSGWATNETNLDQPVRVQVWINGEVHGSETSAGPRPAAQPFVAETGRHSGFDLRVHSPEGFDSRDMLTFVLESGRATDVIHCGTIEVTSLYLNLARLCKESEELRHERDGARAERDGLSAALAGESRRVADLDRAVNQTGWQKHVLEQEIAAMKRSRFWKAREAWFRATGREAKAR